MLKKIAIGVGIVIVGFVVLVLMQPATFKVERSQTIGAEPSAVFALIDDFHNWPKWSPWEGLDPNIETTFSGPESGEGAVYAWTGNADVGKGQMTITKSVEPSEVVIDLVFVEPFASRADTVFTIAPEGEGTKVTWAMSGDNDFMAKAMSLFMDMDAMIGADFEKGLGQLEAMAEAGDS